MVHSPFCPLYVKLVRILCGSWLYLTINIDESNSSESSWFGHTKSPIHSTIVRDEPDVKINIARFVNSLLSIQGDSLHGQKYQRYKQVFPSLHHTTDTTDLFSISCIVWVLVVHINKGNRSISIFKSQID